MLLISWLYNMRTHQMHHVSEDFYQTVYFSTAFSGRNILTVTIFGQMDHGVDPEISDLYQRKS